MIEAELRITNAAKSGTISTVFTALLNCAQRLPKADGPQESKIVIISGAYIHQGLD